MFSKVTVTIYSPLIGPKNSGGLLPKQTPLIFRIFHFCPSGRCEIHPTISICSSLMTNEIKPSFHEFVLYLDFLFCTMLISMFFLIF